MNKILQSL